MNFLWTLAAATTAPADVPGWVQLVRSPLLPLALVFLVMFSFMNRSKRNESKQREEMLKQLKRGDRIQSIGGILGTVLRTEEGRVEVKVDEANNTKIWFARSAISRVVEADKAEVK